MATIVATKKRKDLKRNSTILDMIMHPLLFYVIFYTSLACLRIGIVNLYTISLKSKIYLIIHKSCIWKYYKL